MKNVMVCVTQQKTCERLIKKGYEFLGGEEGELFIIHVAGNGYNILGNLKEAEALEYLYEKAKAYEADLTVVRSDHPIDTLAELVEKNKITHVILGTSREVTENSFVIKLKKRIRKNADLIIVPPKAEPTERQTVGA